eukprot:2927183-Pleurochrysis_carterae.AAC.2
MFLARILFASTSCEHFVLQAHWHAWVKFLSACAPLMISLIFFQTSASFSLGRFRGLLRYLLPVTFHVGPFRCPSALTRGVPLSFALRRYPVPLRCKGSPPDAATTPVFSLPWSLSAQLRAKLEQQAAEQREREQARAFDCEPEFGAKEAEWRGSSELPCLREGKLDFDRQLLSAHGRSVKVDKWFRIP